MVQAELKQIRALTKVFRELPPAKRKTVLDFAEYLHVKERRKVLRRSLLAGEKEYKQGKLKSSSDINELKEMLK